MGLSFKDVKNVSVEDIYEEYLNTINRIYDKILFTGISREKYCNLVKNAIKESKYSNQIAYKSYLEREIYRNLIKEVECKFKEDEYIKCFLSNYIEQNIVMTDDFEEAYKMIIAFGKMVKTFNVELTPQLITELINSYPQISNILQLLFDKKKIDILNGRINYVYKDSFIISFMKEFFNIKGLNIKINNNNRSKSLTKEEEKEIILKIQAGDAELRDKFIMSNMNLVKSIANRYVCPGMEINDLIQEGTIGLMTAIEKFNTDMDVMFSTYAVSWIRQAIVRSIENKSRVIRIPVHMHEKINLYKKVECALENELMRTPTIKEIADVTGFSENLVINLKQLQTDYILSLNTYVFHEEKSTLEDFVSIDECTPEEEVLSTSLSEILDQLFIKSNLTDREIQVIKYRFGFYSNNNTSMTLEEVGKIFGVKRERVRQIEASAMIKIRRCDFLKDVALFMKFPKDVMKEVEEFNSGYPCQRRYTKIYKEKMFIH